MNRLHWHFFVCPLFCTFRLCFSLKGLYLRWLREHVCVSMSNCVIVTCGAAFYISPVNRPRNYICCRGLFTRNHIDKNLIRALVTPLFVRSCYNWRGSFQLTNESSSSNIQHESTHVSWDIIYYGPPGLKMLSKHVFFLFFSFCLRVCACCVFLIVPPRSEINSQLGYPFRRRSLVSVQYFVLLFNYVRAAVIPSSLLRRWNLTRIPIIFG